MAGLDDKAINDQPPIGMRPDGELVTIEPGQPIPQPKILTPEGDEMTPAEYADAAKFLDANPE